MEVASVPVLKQHFYLFIGFLFSRHLNICGGKGIRKPSSATFYLTWLLSLPQMAQLSYLLCCGLYWLHSLRHGLLGCWISLWAAAEDPTLSQSCWIPNSSTAVASADHITASLSPALLVSGFALLLCIGIEFSFGQLLDCVLTWSWSDRIKRER